VIKNCSNKNNGAQKSDFTATSCSVLKN